MLKQTLNHWQRLADELSFRFWMLTHSRAAEKAAGFFWKFVHNAVIHPLMAFPWNEPEWLDRLHVWTGERAYGAE